MTHSLRIKTKTQHHRPWCVPKFNHGSF